MSARPDVVVLGSGIEGLVAAATLARAGRRVVVLEERDAPGGTAAREEFHPGFHAPGLFLDCALARRGALESLGLAGHGLAWRGEEPPLLVPDRSGCPLLFRRDPARMSGELPGEERERLARVTGLCARAAPVVAGVIDDAPPDPASPGAAELVALGRRALAVRRMGRREMTTLARVLPSSADDWMRDELRMESLRVALTAPALAGTVLGPRAPGTSTLVFLRQALGGAEPVGGPAALVAALLELCRSSGVELRTGARLAGLAFGARGVEAVELDGAEPVACGAVLSSLHPGRTLLELVPAGLLARSTETAVQTWRSRGSTAILRLALSAPPVFAGRERDSIEHAVSARDLDQLERASDCLKYDALPERPWVEVRVPSRSDPSLAPPGAAVAVVTCHTVPREPRLGGWNPAARVHLEDAMLSALEELAPGARASVVERELLTPADVAARHGSPGGHPFDGELALDQLWVQRPSLGLSRYATPLPGLYLGGPGSHPGGPFLGRAGALAARALLARR